MYSPPHRLEINILTSTFFCYVIRRENREHDSSTQRRLCKAVRSPGTPSLWGELAFSRSSAMAYLWKSSTSTCKQLQPSQHLSNLNMLHNTHDKTSLFLFGEEEKGVSIKKLNLKVLTLKTAVSLSHRYLRQRTDMIKKYLNRSSDSHWRGGWGKSGRNKRICQSF